MCNFHTYDGLDAGFLCKAAEGDSPGKRSVIGKCYCFMAMLNRSIDDFCQGKHAAFK